MTVRAEPRGAPHARAVASSLRHRRLTLGLTQEDLASASGVSLRTLRNIERGAVSPRPSSLGLLERVLGPLPAPRAEPSANPSAVLPPAPRPFLGRDAELEHLAGVDAGLVVVHGMAGVGKSALALHAAHRVAADRDPVLRVALGGGNVPRSADDALADLLGALGVDADDLPADVAARQALFRRRTAEGRGLVLLDDAADDAQVSPLLPAGARWLTLVTSRAALAGLPATRRVPLAPLAPAEAAALLSRLLPDGERDGDDVRGLVRACAGLPLALRLVAGRGRGLGGGGGGGGGVGVAASARVPTPGDSTGDSTGGSSGDSTGEEVRAAFAVSYARLAAHERTALRWACVTSGTALEVPLVAAACGLDAADAADLLDDLADAGLLLPGADPGTYDVHDLVRAYARERSAAEDPPDVVRRVRGRVTAWYLDAVHAVCAAYAAHPYPEPDAQGPAPTPASPSDRGPRPGEAADAARVRAASAWLDRHRDGWWPAVRDAVRRGDHASVVRACRDLYWYSDCRFHAVPWHDLFGLGVEAALALGRDHEAAVHRAARGWAHGILGRVEDADADLTAAAERFRAWDSPVALAWTAWITSQVVVPVDAGRALALAEHAWSHFDAVGDTGHALMARVGVAQARLALGDLGVALPELEAAVADASAPADPGGALAHTLTHAHLVLCRGRREAGDHAGAVAQARLALALAPHTDRPVSVARATFQLGLTLQAVDPIEADAVLRRACDLAADVGDTLTASRAAQALAAAADADPSAVHGDRRGKLPVVPPVAGHDGSGIRDGEHEWNG